MGVVPIKNEVYVVEVLAAGCIVWVRYYKYIQTGLTKQLVPNERQRSGNNIVHSISTSDTEYQSTYCVAVRLKYNKRGRTGQALTRPKLRRWGKHQDVLRI